MKMTETIGITPEIHQIITDLVATAPCNVSRASVLRAVLAYGARTFSWHTNTPVAPANTPHFQSEIPPPLPQNTTSATAKGTQLAPRLMFGES
jgi:hypothetical protein